MPIRQTLFIGVLSFLPAFASNKPPLSSHQQCNMTLTGDVDLEKQPDGPLPGGFDHPNTQQNYGINPRYRPRTRPTMQPLPMAEAPAPEVQAEPVAEAAPVPGPNPTPPEPPPPAKRPPKTFRVSAQQTAELEGRATFPANLTSEQNLALALVKMLRPELFDNPSRRMTLILDAIFDMQKPLINAQAKPNSILWNAFFNVPEGAAGKREQKKTSNCVLEKAWIARRFYRSVF